MKYTQQSTQKLFVAVFVVTVAMLLFSGTAHAAPPAAPNYNVVIGPGVSGQITLDETDVVFSASNIPPGVDYIRWYISTTPNELGSPLYTFLATHGGTITSVEAMRVNWETTYYFTAKSVTALGAESENTTQISITTPVKPVPVGDPPAPEFSVELSETTDGHALITIDQKPVEAVSFRLYESTVAGQLGTVRYDLDVVTNSVWFNAIAEGLTRGVPYYYVLRSVNAQGVESTNTQTKTLYIPPVGVTLKVLSPNNGEIYYRGDTVTIKWESDGSGLVNISLYQGDTCGVGINGKIGCGFGIPMNPQPPTALATGVPNTGSYNWMIPPHLTLDDNYYIRVSSTNYLWLADYSDAPFSISAPSEGIATITSPRAGEEVSRGSMYSFRWTSSNIPQDFEAEIYLYNSQGSRMLNNGYRLKTYVGEGMYSRRIPMDMPLGSGYYIELKTGGGQGDYGYAGRGSWFSEPFTIVENSEFSVSVEITSQSQWEEVSGMVPVRGKAWSSLGARIAKVELTANGLMIYSGVPALVKEASGADVYALSSVWDSTAVPNGNYFLGIKATDVDGNTKVSEWTQGRWVIVANNADTTPPDAPTFDVALDGGNPPTNIAVPYITVSDDTESLRLYMSQAQGVLGEMIYSNLPVSDGGFIFYLEDLAMKWDTTYYFTLRAVDAAGNESINTLQKAVALPKDPIGDPVPIDITPPPAPKYGVEIGHIGGEPTSVVFGFTDVSDNAVYLRIYRSIVKGQLGVLQTTGIPANVKGYSVGIVERGLEWGQTYYFTVRAVTSSAVESTNISTNPLTVPNVVDRPDEKVVIAVTSPRNGAVTTNAGSLLIEWRADAITPAHQQLAFDITIIGADGETFVRKILSNLLSSSNGPDKVVKSSTSNKWSFGWRVPADFPKGIYRVRVGATWLLNGETIGATDSYNNPYFVVKNFDPVGEPSINTEGCLPDGTLVKLPDDLKIYVINDCQKQWISSAEEFNGAGYEWEDVQDVAEDIILMHPELARRIAELLRFSDSPDIFIMRDGQLHRIPDAGTLAARRLRWEDVEVVAREAMQGVSRGFDFMPEGAIMRASNGIDVYIIKYMGNKQFKRLILNPSVFNSYGHLAWEDIREVSQATINAFPEAMLVRVVGTNQVYRLSPNGDVGIRQRISLAKLAAMGMDVESIYEINDTDFRNYTEGTTLE